MSSRLPTTVPFNVGEDHDRFICRQKNPTE